MTLSVLRGPTYQPPRILVYGTEGIGKSTFAASAPRPIFVSTEDGLDAIACDRFPLAANYLAVMDSLSALASESHEYRTVVIDSLDWLERLIWDDVCREHGVDSIERVGGGYSRGYVFALKLWREVLAMLSRLRTARRMLVLLIAHAKCERVEDPECPAYDRHAPRLDKRAAALVCEWCDVVAFASRRIRVQIEDAPFGQHRGVAQPVGAEGGERILRCVGGPACLAKNRYGLPDVLPLSWDAFMVALKERMKKETEVENG